MQDTACNCLFDARNGDNGDGDGDNGDGDGDGAGDGDGGGLSGVSKSARSKSAKSKSAKRGKRRKRRKRKRLKKQTDEKFNPGSQPGPSSAVNVAMTPDGSKAAKSGRTRRAVSSGPIDGSGPITKSDYVKGHCYKSISQARISSDMSPVRSFPMGRGEVNYVLDELYEEKNHLRQGEEDNRTRQRKRLRQHKYVPDLSNEQHLAG